jgi:hypothetical protein
MLNKARGFEVEDDETTEVPKPEITDPNALYMNSATNPPSSINASGKTYTDASGNALKNNFVIEGTVTITDIIYDNAHLQFRFSQGYRFLLWDANGDGTLGAGYIGGGTVNDKTSNVPLYDATKGLTIKFAVVVDNGKAYWFINDTLVQTFYAPTLEYFNIGCLQMNAVVYDVKLTVKSENSAQYAELIEKYDI